MIDIHLRHAIKQLHAPALDPGPVVAASRVARREQESFGLIEVAVVEHRLTGVKGQRGTGRVGRDETLINNHCRIRTTRSREYFRTPDLQSRRGFATTHRSRFLEPAQGCLVIIAAHCQTHQGRRKGGQIERRHGGGPAFQYLGGQARGSCVIPQAGSRREGFDQPRVVERRRVKTIELLAAGAAQVMEVHCVGIDQLQAESAAQPVERIALVKKKRTGPVAKLFAQADDRRQLGACNRIAATRLEPGSQR